jgi:prepilin peptidase CpaA
LGLTGAAAIADGRTGKIPNRLIVVGLVLAAAVQVGLALHTLEPVTPPAVAVASLKALGAATVDMLVCSIVPLVLYLARGIGGGDVKLLAVSGALIAAGPGLELTQAALLVAGLFGVVKLLWAGRLLDTLARMAQRVRRFVGRGPPPPVERGAMTELRFGPPVFVAACYLAVSHWASAETHVSAPPSHQTQALSTPLSTGNDWTVQA